MAELGIIASVIQIADVGLRLSIKLYTFGEIVASADRSVISISKDVSLTSSVLKELGQILDKDGKAHLLSENAVDTADTVVKECLEVFQEMESILVKKLPNLSTQAGKTARPVLLLERLRWSYLQPKLQLLRSNLDRLKSTLLLMLNVITYARQVAGKTEPPSVIADQRSLIEDLARSNQEYIRKYETLKLAIDADPAGQKEESKDLDFGSMSISKPDVTPDADVETDAINITMAVQETASRGILGQKSASSDAEDAERHALVFHVKHYLDLLNNLLNEVDETKYEIRDSSRDAMRFNICRTYEQEMQQLEGTLDLTARSNAEKQLAPLAPVLKERIKHARDISTRPLAASAGPISPPNATIERAFFGNNSAPMPIPGTNQSAQVEEQARPASKREPPMRRQQQAMDLLGSPIRSTETFSFDTELLNAPRHRDLTIGFSVAPQRPSGIHEEADTLDPSVNPDVWAFTDDRQYRRTSVDSRIYQVSPLDSSSDSEDDEALEIGKSGHWGSEERVYRGKCSRGSVLEFLRSVMFVWPNELNGRVHEVTDSLQNVEFASRDHRFRLDDFSHSLFELHERLDRTAIGLARDEDLDQLQAKLIACEDAVELCESFTSTVKALIARDVPLEGLGNVRLQDKGLSDSKQDIKERIDAIQLPRFIKTFATRRSLYGFLPPSKYGRLSEQRLKVPRKYGKLGNVVQTSTSYPRLKEKANEMPGFNYAAQSSPAVDVVNDLVGLWTSL